jgi:hypothetical protein
VPVAWADNCLSNAHWSYLFVSAPTKLNVLTLKSSIHFSLQKNYNSMESKYLTGRLEVFNQFNPSLLICLFVCPSHLNLSHLIATETCCRKTSKHTLMFGNSKLSESQPWLGPPQKI